MLPLKKARPLVDSFGREVNYLRISLTEDCNFKCIYCVPPEGLPKPSKKLLTVNEIKRIARIAFQLGFRKIRLTGGEPLLRPDLVDIVSELHSIHSSLRIYLTTNGLGLEKKIPDLKIAGLTGVNISLDSLDPTRFHQLTKRKVFERVWKGIQETAKLSLEMKINVVVIRGMSDQEIFQFVQLASDLDIEIRFLEFMPLCGSAWKEDSYYPLNQVKELIEKKFQLIPRIAPHDQPARVFTIPGSKGSIGFIASLSDSFCNHCSRMRVTCEGKIRPCLFSNLSFDLKKALQSEDDQKLKEVFIEATRLKPKGHNWREGTRKTPERYPLIHNIGG